MPTGYTDRIKDGITFQQFAMGCARAFGACVTMRDDSSDKAIPERFEPSGWNKKELSKAYKELESINGMSVLDAEKLSLIEFAKECKRQTEAITKDRKLMSQYKDMLRQVKQWQPPTPHHIEFKEFMVEQIEGSIKFDGMEEYYIEHPPKKFTGEEWLAEKKAKIQKDIDYHAREDTAKIDRTNQRNQWVDDLRNSLTVQ